MHFSIQCNSIQLLVSQTSQHCDGDEMHRCDFGLLQSDVESIHDQRMQRKLISEERFASHEPKHLRICKCVKHKHTNQSRTPETINSTKHDFLVYTLEKSHLPNTHASHSRPVKPVQASHGVDFHRPTQFYFNRQNITNSGPENASNAKRIKLGIKRKGEDNTISNFGSDNIILIFGLPRFKLGKGLGSTTLVKHRGTAG